MARNNNSGFQPGLFLDLIRQIVRNRGEVPFLQELRAFFALFIRPALIVSAFRNRDNRKAAMMLDTAFNGSNDRFQPVRNLRQQHNIGSPGNPRIQRQPTGFISHEFDDHDPPMAIRRSMNPIYHIRSNIDGCMKSKSNVCSPDIIINRLRQSDHIQSFFRQQVGRLMRAISSQSHKTIESHLLIVGLHSFHFIDIVVLDHAHISIGLTGRSKDCPS